MNTEILGVALQIVLLIVISYPLGKYIAKVYKGEKTWSDFMKPVERLIYKVAGVNPEEEMNWKQFLKALLILNAFWFVWGMVLLCTQQWLPLNPDGNANQTPDLAFNTCISFMVNCNLQHYSGESGLTYFTQLFVIMLFQFITAATGMDALTHAIEGYITKGAWELSDMFHIKAIEIIARSLRSAVKGEKEGREGMALGQYVAGMGFSNVGLGVDHSMAHTLSAYYDTPHGKACAILLPTVMAYNADYTGEKYRDIAIAMGVKGVEKMTQAEYRKAAVDAVRQLSEDVGIPTSLKGIVRKEDIPELSKSAYADACRPGNPRETSVKDIEELYRSLL